jgi:hypothetical protein
MKSLEFHRGIDFPGGATWKSKDYIIEGRFSNDGTPVFKVSTFKIPSMILGETHSLKSAQFMCREHQLSQGVQPEMI